MIIKLSIEAYNNINTRNNTNIIGEVILDNIAEIHFLKKKDAISFRDSIRN